MFAERTHFLSNHWHTINDILIVTKSYNLITLPFYLFKKKKLCYTLKSKIQKGSFLLKAIMMIRPFRYRLPALLLASVLFLTLFSGCSSVEDASSAASVKSGSNSSGPPNTDSDDITDDNSSEAANQSAFASSKASASSKTQPYSGGSDGTVDLFAAGDNIYHDSVINSGRTANGFDFTQYYEYLANDIKNADIALVNQNLRSAEIRWASADTRTLILRRSWEIILFHWDST